MAGLVDRLGEELTVSERLTTEVRKVLGDVGYDL